MDEREQARVEALIDRDPELRGLWREHLEFERRLSELDDLSHLTPGEELERKRLQKRKLAGKDRIAAILRHHAAS